MRSHVEVDPIVGLKGLEALRPLRDEYAPALELQLCAFAQEGILQAPGTEALLARALREGADLVGGCPYNDTDPHAHVDTSSGSRGSSAWMRTSTPTSPMSPSISMCGTSASRRCASAGRAGWRWAISPSWPRWRPPSRTR